MGTNSCRREIDTKNRHNISKLTVDISKTFVAIAQQFVMLDVVWISDDQLLETNACLQQSVEAQETTTDDIQNGATIVSATLIK